MIRYKNQYLNIQYFSTIAQHYIGHLVLSLGKNSFLVKDDVQPIHPQHQSLLGVQ